MPVPSTSVKWMHSAMPGAPVLDNNWGDLTALLRACAVNGFNVKPVQTITCNGTTATVQCSGHGYLEHQVVKIEGAEPAGYNGEHRIVSVVDGNTVTIELAAGLAPATQAAGQTLQMRAAPLGFEQLFSSGNKLALRSTNLQSPRNVLRVDDSRPAGYTTTWAKFARVTMAQGMSDIDTFIGARAPFDPLNPTKNEVPSGSGTSGYYGWYKWYYARNSDSNIADTSAPVVGQRAWALIGDDRGFYLLVRPAVSSLASSVLCGFVDFDSLQPADAYSTVLAAYDNYITAATAFQNYSKTPLVKGSTTDGVVLMRDYLGEGGNVNAGSISLDVTGTSGFDSGISTVPFPNGPGNGLLLHPMWLQQSNQHIRGRLRGILSVLHTHTLGDRAIVSNIPGLPGRKILLVAVPSRIGFVGSVAFDITGPWGS